MRVSPSGIAAERTPLGRDRARDSSRSRSGAAGGRHTLVLGATGSGKTVTQTWIVCTAIEAGLGAVVVDPKGDRRMREELAESRAGAGASSWSGRRPARTSTTRSDTARPARSPTGRWRASASQSPTTSARRSDISATRYARFAARRVTVSLRELVEKLDPASLEELAQRLPGRAGRGDQPVPDAVERSPAQRSERRARPAGDHGRVRPGAWLDPATPGAVAFDLLSAMRRRAVVYFALEADSWPLLARMLAAAIVGDLRGAMSALQRSPVPTWSRSTSSRRWPPSRWRICSAGRARPASACCSARRSSPTCAPTSAAAARPGARQPLHADRAPAGRVRVGRD